MDYLIRKTVSMIVAIDLMNTSAANHLPYLSRKYFFRRGKSRMNPPMLLLVVYVTWLQTVRLVTTRRLLLRDIFVIGVLNDRLGERLLAEDESEPTFDLAVKKVEAFERARQGRASSKSTTVSAVHRTPEQQSGKKTLVAPKRTTTTATCRACYRCGSSDHLVSSSIVSSN